MEVRDYVAGTEVESIWELLQIARDYGSQFQII